MLMSRDNWMTHLTEWHRRFSCLRTRQTWLTQLLQDPRPWKRLLWRVVLRSSPEAQPVHGRPCPLCFLTASVSLKGSKKGSSSRVQACKEHKPVNSSLTYPTGCGICVLATNNSAVTNLEPFAYVTALCVLWSCSQATSLSRLEVSSLLRAQCLPQVLAEGTSLFVG